MSFLWFVAGLMLAATGTVVAVGASAASRLVLSRWVTERRRGAEIATALLSAPGPVIGTAVGVASLGTILAAFGLTPWLAPLAPPVAAAVALGVAVPLLLVAGYVVPRAAGRRWAEPAVRAASPWLGRAARLVTPLVPAPRDGDAELRRLSREPRARTVQDEIAVISGVLAFTERPVREVMTPRTEIVAVAEGTPAEEVAMIFAESGYSRLPVYRDSLDQILGIIYAFDLLRTPTGETTPLRPVSIVPASRRSADVLFELQRERRQFAVVLDEFGGTAGIVTFEDLLEELVGEIFDEHDGAEIRESPTIDLIELPGTAALDDVRVRFDTPLAGPAETVGGFLATALGRIPRVGERIVLGGLEFDVLAGTPTRIDRVVIRRAPVPAAGPVTPSA